MSSPSDDLLPFFVYGTLCPGQPNYWLIRGRTLAERPGRVRDLCLFSVGSFPMAIARSQLPAFVHPKQPLSEWLHGYLMVPHPQHYARLVADLDQLENYFPGQLDQSEYHRVMCEVVQADQTITAAWIYLGNPAYLRPEMPLIPDGDWVAYRREKGSNS